MQMSSRLPAIFFGITVGFISLIPLQAATNHASRQRCADLTDTHQLVHVRAFAGDSVHCVDRRYL